MRQDWAVWLILKVMEADIRLNEVGKAHDNAITTGHKGVLGKQARKKIKRSMRLLRKFVVILYKGLPDLREDSQHGYQMQTRS